MPRITEIKEQMKHKHRRSIYIDGEFLCGVSDEAVLRLGLKPGRELTDMEIARLQTQEIDIQVREQALRWLDRRAYARGELNRRLQQKQFPADAIARVLDRLESAGVLNDEQFAHEWIRERTRAGQMGGRRVRMELRQKGVSDEVIEKVWSVDGDADEELSCEDLAKRKWRSYRNVEHDVAKRRLAGFLTRRGFDVDDVIRVVARVAAEKEDEV